MHTEQIISAARRNDRKAQTALYNMYRVSWYQICLRYNGSNAADVLQNALVKIFRKLDLFDPNKGSFKTWSSKVVVNENLMFLRQRANVFVNEEINEAVHTYDSDESALDRMSAKELIQLIHKLPAGYRTVFNLYVIEGYSHQEISQNLGISIGTSKSQLSKARKLLKRKLEVLL